MAINLPLDASLTMSLAQTSNNPLDLKINQILDAKVIGPQIMLNTFALNVADKTVLVQAQLPLILQPGQSLQLQVVKLLPAPEFKVVFPGLPPSANQTPAQFANTQILKLLNFQPQALANTSAGVSVNQLAAGQQLQANIISIANGKVTLQLLTANTLSSGSSVQQALQALQANKTNPLITLDIKQLVLADAENTMAQSATKAPTLPLTVLTAGAQINLQVLKTGSELAFAVSIPAASTEQKLTELFKQLLPIQASPAAFLNNLNQILPALENNATVAETLKQLAQEILNSTPLKAQLTEPAQLKQTIDQSGLFLEAKLAELLSGKSGVSLHEDIKLKLVKFIQLLTAEINAQAGEKSRADSIEILKDILQKTNSALAKLTLDQFNSLPIDESPKQSWVLELPFFHNRTADTVEIEIEQDKQSDNESAEKNWAVSITITPPELATIHCRISCYDGAVNTRFWSDSADTVDKINAHLDYLKQQFEQKGLKTGFMEAHQGKPAQTSSFKKPFANLLNEKV